MITYSVPNCCHLGASLLLHGYEFPARLDPNAYLERNRTQGVFPRIWNHHLAVLLLYWVRIPFPFHLGGFTVSFQPLLVILS